MPAIGKHCRQPYPHSSRSKYQHDIAVRQGGYKDFRTTVNVAPGEKQLVLVKMAKDVRFQMPEVTAEIKMSVNPDRAAVFLDDLFVGHVGEFGGAGKGLLVAPGHRKITISLPGYQSFHTEVDLAPNQKFEVKTELQKQAIGAAYTPLSLGPDGKVYAQNDGHLFVIGN